MEEPQANPYRALTTVYYFPWLVGHVDIAVRVVEPESADELFRGHYAFNSAARKAQAAGYVEPIAIQLPPSNIDEKTYDALTQFKQGEYGALRNNCAHTTQTVMHLLGYLPNKPVKSTALLPRTVAEQASTISIESYTTLNEALRGANHIRPEYKLQLLLNGELNIQHAQLVEQRINQLTGRHTTPTIQTLKKILKIEPGLPMYQALLKAHREAPQSIRATLASFIELIPAADQKRARILIAIDGLRAEARQLNSEGHTHDVNQLKLLADRLALLVQSIRVETTPKFFQFTCLFYINECRNSVTQPESQQAVNNLAAVIEQQSTLKVAIDAVSYKATGALWFYGSQQHSEQGNALMTTADTIGLIRLIACLLYIAITGDTKPLHDALNELTTNSAHESINTAQTLISCTA